MPYVKLDTAILNSTLWFERLAREVFITSLLMAEPHELVEETEALEVDSLKPIGFKVPPGWYGFVPAAGIGILRRALLEDTEEMRVHGFDALRYLGSPDHESRSKEHEGRRMVRVDGGFIILNYFKYRDKDHTNAIRQRRHRLKQRNAVMSRSNGVTVTHTYTDTNAEVQKGAVRTQLPENGSSSFCTKTQVPPHIPSIGGEGAKFKKSSKRRVLEPDPDFDRFWEELPVRNRIGKKRALQAWHKAIEEGATPDHVIAGVCQYRKAERKRAHQDDYRPLHPATWLNQGRWDDGEEIEKPYNPCD